MAAAISAAGRGFDLVISLSIRQVQLGLPDKETCVRDPLFLNASAHFRMRNHDHASTMPVGGSGRDYLRLSGLRRRCNMTQI